MARHSKTEDDSENDSSSAASEVEEEEEEESDSDEEMTSKKKGKKSKAGMALIDDSAVHSGSDDGEEEEEEDDDDNEYMKDGFVVDDEEEEEEVPREKRRRKRKKKRGLEDSSDDDDDMEEFGRSSRKKKKRTRLKKRNQLDMLDEEDLRLIQETRGEHRDGPRRNRRDADPFDEEGLDDFIDDDLGEMEERGGGGRRRPSQYQEEEDDDAGWSKPGVSEAQLNEASEIFGTDYLDMMDRDDEDDTGKGKSKRERGVGVDLQVGSEEELISEEEDDDLFASDEEDEGDPNLSKRQREDLKRQRRDKREQARKERRRKVTQKRTDARKARLRRAFEPVQLVENFCTDRDDKIRALDGPERFFDWNVPFHNDVEEKEEEAMWIMARVPEIAAEYFAPLAGEEDLNEVDKKQRSILESIMEALRFMHEDKLEPEFIKRYRVDIVSSPAVQKNLNAVMDEDGEWEKMTTARKKVESLLTKVLTVAVSQESQAVMEDRNNNLTEDLDKAQGRLDEALTQETKAKLDLSELSKGKTKVKGENKDDEEDDELFGDDDEDDEETKKARERLQAHLTTLENLVQERAERVATLSTNLQTSTPSGTSSQKHSQTVQKLCRTFLLHEPEYRHYLSRLMEERHIRDLAVYLNLTGEGNDALLAKIHGTTGKKRSRRFDRDYYRTCVSEGLRGIAYRFVLGPMRVGIMLEDTFTKGRFSYDRSLASEELSEPKDWVSPRLEQSPKDFAENLVNSGELAMLAQSQHSSISSEMRDPLKRCRYVAAMELAHEPRVKRFLREIYRKHAVIRTYPTAKGMDAIDPFHEYYGLHLIKDKPLSNHFPYKEEDLQNAYEDRDALKEEANKREYNSCLQYLRITKAVRSGDIGLKIHMPYILPPESSLTPEERTKRIDEWYKFSGKREQDLSPFLGALERIYLPPDGDTNEWNGERRKILRLAIVAFLLPQFEGEARKDLQTAAFLFGTRQTASSLRKMAMEGPYRPSHLLGENRFLVPTNDLPLVGVCVASGGNRDDPSYLAAISGKGEQTDSLVLPHGTRMDSPNFRESLIKFLMTNRPAAVVVGTSGGLQSRRFARFLGDNVQEAMEKWNNRFIQGNEEDDEEFEGRCAQFRGMFPQGHEEDEDDAWKCNVDLVDDNIAQLFARSVRSTKEYPEANVNLKCAVGTARHAQNPLSGLCYAWSVASDAGIFGAEMLFLDIDPLQRLLPKAMLLKEYERVLCDVVSEVGVDINAACALPHLHGMLQFIPGLGARKAAALKQSIQRIGGVVESRKALLAKRLVGPTVYNNAVAFLRIRDKDQLQGQHLHPLDDTRLHPDVYHRNQWAVKIAIDAMETARPETSEEFSIKSLRDVMANSQDQVRKLFQMTKAQWEGLYGPTFNIPAWDPKINVPAERWRDNVEELDLETFAKMIESDGMGKWLSHLLMIKWEFRLPFEDPRTPMEPLSGDKLFSLLTGESDMTLRPGKELTGKIQRNTDYGSRLSLENDLPGFIHLRNLAEEHVESPDDIVQQGSVVTAIITEVKKMHISVDLSLKLCDFKRPKYDWERPIALPPIDVRYFDMDAARKLEDKRAKDREAHIASLKLLTARREDMPMVADQRGGKPRRTGRVTRRACGHPAFRNARHDEMDRELREGGDSMVGEALIRPSSQTADSLAIHWVVRLGCIKIIEVKEEDKDTDASIGNKLAVKNEMYESIDELLGRYIAPMNDRVEEVTNHRKMLNLAETDVDNELKRLKGIKPSGIYYHLCWSEEHPGYVTLRYILGKTVRNHPIGLTPDGFLWRRTPYPTMDHLLNDFKRSPTGPPGTSGGGGGGGGGSQSRSVASTHTSHTRQPPPPQRPSENIAKKSSRWGERAAPAAPPANNGWATPAAPVASTPGWGAPPPASTNGGNWGIPQSSRPPPPSSQPPPPGGFPRPPPNMGMPPPPPIPPPPGLVPPPGFPPAGMPPPPSGPPPTGYPSSASATGKW